MRNCGEKLTYTGHILLYLSVHSFMSLSIYKSISLFTSFSHSDRRKKTNIIIHQLIERDMNNDMLII